MALTAQQIAQITGRLWTDGSHATYALLDGAGIPGLLDRLYGESDFEFECLYSGEIEPDVAEVAPYLARIEPDSGFARWLLSGWGEYRGILAQAPAELDLPVLRRHFRKLNMVYGPDAAPLLFRYYDPRVMRIFLPTCDETQLRNTFGPVSRFLVEDGAGKGWTLSMVSGALVQEPFNVM